jgi:hypothetical protein
MTTPDNSVPEVRVTHLCVELIATGDGDMQPRILASDDAPLPMQLGVLELAKSKLLLEQFAHETGLFDDDPED